MRKIYLIILLSFFYQGFGQAGPLSYKFGVCATDMLGLTEFNYTIKFNDSYPFPKDGGGNPIGKNVPIYQYGWFGDTYLVPEIAGTAGSGIVCIPTTYGVDKIKYFEITTRTKPNIVYPSTIITSQGIEESELIKKGEINIGGATISAFTPQNMALNLSRTEVCASETLDFMTASPAGYPSTAYHWLYSTDNVNWFEVPAAFQDNSYATFSIKDLLGDNHVNFFNKPIYFKLGYNGIPQFFPIPERDFTATVSVIYSRCAPMVTNISYEGPKCSNDTSIQKIEVGFDRPLNTAEGEVLKSFSIRDRADPTIVLFQYDTDVIFSGQTFSFPKADLQKIKLENGHSYFIQQQAYIGSNGKGILDSDILYDMKYIAPTALSFTATKDKDVLCNGAKTGSINITASGGTGVYSYIINPPADPNYPLAEVSFTSPSNITGLASGDYIVTLKDSNGCEKAAQSINIGQPASPITYTNKVVDAEDYNSSTGSNIITISGGKGPYTLKYKKLADPDINYSSDLSSVSNQVALTNLEKGNYIFKITDQNGCQPVVDGNFEIGVFKVEIENEAIKCYGDQTTLKAKITRDPETNTSYDYAWTNNGSTSNTAIGGIGSHKVTVTQDGISRSATLILTNSNQPAKLACSITTNSEKCFNTATGTITLKPSGGSEPYSYQFYDILGNTIAGRSGSIAKSDDILEIGGFIAGDYNVIITDKNNCVWDNQNQFPSAVKIKVASIDPLEINPITQTQPSTALSSDGTIKITATGGTPPYTYVWTKGTDAYSPTTDSATGITSGLTNGTYSVLVTDDNGCTKTSDDIVLDALGVKVDTYTDIKCFGEATGSINITAFGGKGSGYTYEWFKIENGIETPQTTTTPEAIKDLTSGTYRVKVRDGINPFVFIDKYLGQPNAPLNVSQSKTNINCAGGKDGTATIIVSDGTPKVDGTYNYIWEKDGTVLPAIITNSNASLEEGDYKVTVVDANSCSKAVTFSIKAPNPIVIPTPAIAKVLIYGQSTGSITMPDITEGNGGYSYKWTYNLDPLFLETSKNISGLKAGEYTLEVRDANVAATDNAGCIATASFTVSQNPELIVDIQNTKFIKCNGNSNGEITAIVSGGVPGYNYVWYNSKNEVIGGDTNKITDLPTEYYKVVVTDFYGAKKTSAVLHLTQPDQLIVSVKDKINVLCYGNATGAINIDITGGTTPYTYQWTKNNAKYSTAKDLADLTVGTYNVVVTDALGHECTATLAQPVEITQPAAPLQITSPGPINLTGFETNNGSIAVTVSGGKPNYTYEWRKDAETTIIASTPSINNLSAGIYHLIVKDDNGCTLPQVDYEVTQPAKLEVLSLIQTPNTDIACNGDLSGEYNMVVTGGVKEYTFEWLNTTTGIKYASVENITTTSTTSKASNLGAGSYVVSVKDVNSNILYGTNTFTISQPDILTFTYTVQDVFCNGGNNGKITLNITGGIKNADLTKPYSIISSGVINNQDGTISGLTKGIYQVRVIDANGCQTPEQSIEIKEPLVSLYIASETITPTTGFGLSTGKVVITAAGGTAGYTYLWKNSLGITVGTNNPTLDNVPADTYTLLITDAKGCTTGNSYIIEEPTKPILTETHLQAKCNGLFGSLIATATGGASYNQNQSDRSYTYKLQNKATGNTITITGNIADFSNIVDGDYTLTATDIGGINSNSIDVTFQQPTPIVVSLASKSNVTCYGSQDGAIAIDVVGGTPFIINGAPVYTYIWKKKNTGTNLYENFTPSSLTALTEGTYAVEVRDANFNTNDATHCVGTLNDIVITQPADFGFEIDKITYKNPSAANGNDGALHFEIKGGKTNYEYKIYTKNDLGVETVLKTISNTSSKMVDFTDLIKDHYYVSVQDDTGCIKYTDFDFTDNPLIISISQTQVISCFEANNGILKATVKGGFGVKTISWYRNNILLPNEHNAELLNVKIGNYYAVVKDSKAIEVTTAPLTIIQPNLVTFTTTQEPVKCLGDNNGTITINAAGGNGTFRYRYFSNGALIKDWVNFTNTTSTVVSGLADGEYTLQVQDTQQCTSTDAVLKITSPTALTINNIIAIPVTGKGLSNGSIAITAQGANGAYTYNWFKAAGTAINQTTDKATNLAAGKYYIIVTDAKGCNLTSPLIEVTEPPLLETSIKVQNVILCNGDKNGSLNPTTIGGLLKPGENYTYQWYENGNPTVLATTTILSGIGKGSYYVIVKDSNGNQATSQILIVTEPNVLDNVLTADYVRCGDFNDWTINATPSGGTAPYSYSWNTGAKTASIQNATPGNYSVVVTDDHGCSITKAIKLTAPAHLDAAEKIKIPTCYEGSDATIVVTPIAGTAPYKYLWNTGEKTNTLSNASAGEYSVEITDARGCIILRKYTIVNPPKDIINLGEDVTLCFDQTLTVNATIDDDKATYFWTSDKGFTSNKAMITVSEPANYTVVVTNKLGCKATDTIKISSQETAISAEFAVSSQVFKNEKIIIVDISNPAPDTVEWVIPANATIISKDKDYAEISFSEAGEYDITLNTTKGNCTAYQTKTILVTEGEYQENNPEETAKNFDLKIYPNPSSGNFTVDITLDKIMPANVKVYSLNNNVLIDSKTDNGKTNYLFNFSLNGLPSGIYFVLFESQQGSKLRKIIIQ